MTRIRQIDAFTSVPFAGNPAGVCILESPADETWMQSVAAEMNVAETAFLWPLEHGFSLRWFTPTTEVDLCGHATLASAHALWESGTLSTGEQAIFNTRSGDSRPIEMVTGSSSIFRPKDQLQSYHPVRLKALPAPSGCLPYTPAGTGSTFLPR